MFKFVPYETRTVGKRAAGILLECFLVVFIFPVDCAGWGDGWNETKLQLRQQREGGENQHGGDVQGCVWGGTGESYSEAGLALRLGSSLRKPTRLCIWWNRWVMWWSRSSTEDYMEIALVSNQNSVASKKETCDGFIETVVSAFFISQFLPWGKRCSACSYIIYTLIAGLGAYLCMSLVI